MITTSPTVPEFLLPRFCAASPIAAIKAPVTATPEILVAIATKVAPRLRGNRGVPVYSWSLFQGLQAVDVTGDEMVLEDADIANGIRWSSAYPAGLDQLVDFLFTAAAGCADVINSEDPRNGIYVLSGFGKLLRDADPRLCAAIETLTVRISPLKIRIVFIDPELSIPARLSDLVDSLVLPLPTYQDIDEMVQDVVRELNASRPEQFEVDEELHRQLVRALQGFSTRDEASGVLLRSIVSRQALSEDTVADILRSKVEKMRQQGLELSTPSPDKLGGLHLLKEWLQDRRILFSAQAADASLPTPKGVLVLGPPGTGKSLFAKACASELDIPLVSLRMSSVLGSHVGESERAFAEILRVTTAAAPVVLWLDEIEKLLSGVGTMNDGGVSNRMFGELLTWLNDKTEPVFVVATSNDIDSVPQELLRKGRFDEIFYVSLPNRDERVEILELKLAKYSLTLDPMTLGEIADRTEGFSGAELSSLVESAKLRTVSRKGELASADWFQLASSTRPLSQANRELFRAREKKAQEWGIPASRPPRPSSPAIQSEVLDDF